MPERPAAPTVRRAAPGDRATILELVPRLVEFGPPPWREPSRMTETDLAVIDAALREPPRRDPAVFVAELDGAVVGFVHVHSQVDYYRRRPHGHVADLVVAGHAQGRGIATALLGEAERWARSEGYDWLTISVFDENRRAAALYEHHGFRRDTRTLVKALGDELRPTAQHGRSGVSGPGAMGSCRPWAGRPPVAGSRQERA